MPAEHGRRGLDRSHFILGDGRGTGVYKKSNDGSGGNQFEQQLQPLPGDRDVEQRESRDIAAGTIEAGHQPERNWILANVKDDRNGLRRPLGCQRRRIAASRNEHGHLSAD